ncbi:hypothetical protein [Teredinibacter turnerae]|uniref:hypothetical protein n=1 Tax=Teredinibacter turnerae TaxID=2426 RepID=UPI00036FD183|nr:hypothetical protein [Teredinibacter turnerae]
MNQLQRFWRNNFDSKVVFSSALGAAALGGLTFLAVKSKIKPVAQAAKVAKNGSAK